MIAFLTLIIWTIVSYDLCKKVNRRDVNRIYCWNMFFATLLLQGFQSIYIGGVDTSLVYARGKIAGIINALLSGMDRYSRYSENATQLSLTGAFILICVYIVSYVFAYPAYKEDDELKMLLNLSVISIAFMTLVTVVGEFHRISMFFGIYNTVLLPKAWKRYQARDSRLKAVYLLEINAVFVAYFLLYGLGNYSLSVYRFFWMN